MRNALAGNLSPSLTACNTRSRWPCTRWLISALLLLAFCPQAFIWELICRWSLGYWQPITFTLSICHLVHVSPCEWSTWLSSADVIDYRWPTGSIIFGETEAIRCKMFMGTFTCTTLQWFSGIPHGQITSFSHFPWCLESSSPPARSNPRGCMTSLAWGKGREIRWGITWIGSVRLR